METEQYPGDEKANMKPGLIALSKTWISQSAFMCQFMEAEARFLKQGGSEERWAAVLRIMGWISAPEEVFVVYSSYFPPMMDQLLFSSFSLRNSYTVKVTACPGATLMTRGVIPL